MIILVVYLLDVIFFMEELRIRSWNIRGEVARSNVKEYLQSKKINILCLQQTKCQAWTDQMKISL